MVENRQGNFFGKNKDIERFIEVFRAMLPIVVFQFCFGFFIFLSCATLGDWRASALPLSILAAVAIFLNILYIVVNWRNPMI
ncbi:MAG TPA: hypothetical protein P5080_05930 [Candidatus Paceibacterota bacterium]|nr:hypothetical protein [Candidatus Pacearchaeota archaeon]HRZ51452.1 hypothetical protein [Candidatus Paceibacterota bacterium]HSA37206.1 hypothetical protein [Candidatus Paceibacterota bacterium]